MIFKIFIIIIIGFGATLFLPRWTVFQNNQSGEVVLIDGKGSITVEKNEELKNLIKSMDDKVEQKPFSREDELGRFNNIWSDITKNMEFSLEGKYPVKYYTPNDDVPLIGTMHNRKPLPVWIDNEHVAYWSGVSETYPIKSRPLFSEYELVILNVDTGEIISTLASQERNIFEVCYYGNEQRFLYITDEAVNKPFEGVLMIEGYFDNRFNFVERKRSFLGSEEKMPLFNNTTCELVNNFFQSETNLKPEDGVAAVISNENGIIHHKKNKNGPAVKININFKANGPILYDHVKDQYYLGATFSKEDQRTKFFYFDREFNLVDSFILPRVHTHTSYPSSSLVGYLSPPLKDGVITFCYYKNLETPYLCHVKKDQNIILTLKGYPRHYVTSPDGCRVFGFISEDKKDFSAGRNFMLDVCK